MQISLFGGRQDGLRHEEHRQFTSPHTGLLTLKLGNAYYHPRRRCMELKWGIQLNFSVIVPDPNKMELAIPQKNVLDVYKNLALFCDSTDVASNTLLFM